MNIYFRLLVLLFFIYLFFIIIIIIIIYFFFLDGVGFIFFFASSFNFAKRGHIQIIKIVWPGSLYSSLEHRVLM